tara:strand:+ start:512 stop:1459 length:948 start_codon:yes stop_codon:yes gene_type:complete
MAIFKLGKRVGPFDISGGLSRGDLKSSAYSKTDKDPRFKQGQNSDNTIGRFRASMGRADGFARPSRYTIRLFPPANLRKLTQTVDFNNVPPGVRARYAQPSGKDISALTNTIGEALILHCDSVQMPGHDLEVEQHEIYGPPYNIVKGHSYSGTISASFYADKFLRERQYLEFWQRMCVNWDTNKAGYLDDYAGKMQIIQLGSDNLRDMPTYAIEAVDVFPETLAPIEYGYGNSNQIVKINVGFQYRKWYNLSLKPGNYQFGAAEQKAPEVKGGSKGIFGALPPELQRIGRGALDQAKTTLPTGKIFGGKVFPPFI